jgi:hypothetical protein
MNRPIPPAPPGWNKTVEDLVAEAQRGERKSVGSPEVDWARTYARSLIPEGTRMPKKGDVYEVIADVEVTYLTHWAAPFTGGGKGVLRAGEQVRVTDHQYDPKPIVFSAQPVNRADVEQRFVPLNERSNPKYSGFSLSMKTIDLHKTLKLIHEDQ